MAVNVGTIQAVIDLRDEMSKKLDAISDKLGGMSQKVGGTTDTLQKMAGVMASAFALSEITAGARKVLDFTGHLDDMSKKSGLTAEAVQELGYAAKLSGGSFDEVSSALAIMARNLSEPQTGAVQMFKSLGLSIKDLQGMKPDAAFEAIGKSIAQIEDPMLRSKVAMEIFGRAGAQLLPVLTSDIAALREEAHTTGNVLSNDLVAKGDELGDKWTTLEGKMQTLQAQGLLPLIDLFMKLPTPIQAVTSSVVSMAPTLASMGVAWMTLGSSLMSVAGTIGGALMGVIIPLVPALAAIAIPLAIVAAAVGAVALVWYKWDAIGPIVENVYNTIKTYLVDKWNAITGGVGNALDKIKSLFNILSDELVGHSVVPDMTGKVKKHFEDMASGAIAEAERLRKQVAEHIKQLAKEMSGKEATEQMGQLAIAFAKLTPAQQANTLVVDEMLKKYEEVRTKYGTTQEALEKLFVAQGTLINQGPLLSQTATNFAVATTRLAEEAQKAMYAAQGLNEDGLLPAGRTLQTVGTEMEDTTRAEDDFAKSLMNVTMALKSVQTDMGSVILVNGVYNEQISKSTSLSYTFGQNLKDAFKGLPDVINKSLQGGGNIGKAIMGSIFSNIFAEDSDFVKNLTSKISGGLGKVLGPKLGDTIGGALGSIIPGLGTLLGSMAGQLIGPLLGKIGQGFKKLWNGIKHLFGGPSEEELQGREVLGKFEETVQEMFKLIEDKVGPIHDKWAQAGALVQQAYIKTGMSAEEAATKAQDVIARLYAASKQGAGATQAVLDEIMAILGVLDRDSQDSLTHIVEKTSNVNDAVRQTTDSVYTLNDGFIRVREGMEKPIVIPITWSVASIPEVDRAAAGWQVNARSSLGKTYEEAVADFLRRNPGDYSRVAAALADRHRYEEAQHNTPGMAEGGIVTRPTLALIGESGPEAVVPLKKKDELKDEIVAMRRDMARMIERLPFALRDAILTRG